MYPKNLCYRQTSLRAFEMCNLFENRLITLHRISTLVANLLGLDHAEEVT